MRKYFAVSLVVLALAATPATAATSKHKKHAPAAHHAIKKSLYDRLGGQPAVSAVVDDFAGRVLADTRINAKFAKSDPARLVTNLKAFVCTATSGPCQYKGQDMKTAHTHMGVTEGEFAALVEDLSASLDKFKVPAAEKGELLGALAPLKPAIVEVPGAATGTALPTDFKPAPAM
jgi:hemoglobin